MLLGACSARRRRRRACDPLQHRKRPFERAPLGGWERRDGRLEGRHAPPPSLIEEPSSARRGLDAPDATVVRIGAHAHEGEAHEVADNARDGGGTDLFGRREVAQRQRAAEDDDGKGGEAWRRQPRRRVFEPEPTQEVDRRGVQAVGDTAGRNLTHDKGCHIIVSYYFVS